MQTVKCHAMQGFKGTICVCKQGKQILYDCTCFEKLDWCSHGFCILKRFFSTFRFNLYINIIYMDMNENNLIRKHRFFS